MMGPGFGEAAAAAMLGKFFKIVILPFGGLCIGVGLLIGWQK
jgi:hypothetical protein